MARLLAILCLAFVAGWSPPAAAVSTTPPPPRGIYVWPYIPCSDSSFLRMLHNGMFPEGGAGPSKTGLFIEVFPSDVIAHPAAIRAAHDEWKR